MNVRPVGAEFLHVDIQTDMKNLIDAFRNFADSPNKTTLLTAS